jgi:hypothetical protein
MDAFLFVLGLAIIANTVYGFVIWVRSMPPGGQRAASIAGAVIVSVVMFPLTALVMLGYVPWRLYKRAQLAA